MIVSRESKQTDGQTRRRDAYGHTLYSHRIGIAAAIGIGERMEW